MAIGGMLRNLGAKGAPFARASASHGDLPIGDPAQRLSLLDALEEAEIAWFWATDAENRLLYLSPSAVHKVAPGAGAIGEQLGRLFEVATGDGEERAERPLT